MTYQEQAEASRIINALGGPSAAGKLLGISKSAVSQWKKNGVPKTQLKYLRLARPDVFKATASAPRRAADSNSAARAGRQPPTTNNILDTVPEHAAVVVGAPDSESLP